MEIKTMKEKSRKVLDEMREVNKEKFQSVSPK